MVHLGGQVLDPYHVLFLPGVGHRGLQFRLVLGLPPVHLCPGSSSYVAILLLLLKAGRWMAFMQPRTRMTALLFISLPLR